MVELIEYEKHFNEPFPWFETKGTTEEKLSMATKAVEENKKVEVVIKKGVKY